MAEMKFHERDFPVKLAAAAQLLAIHIEKKGFTALDDAAAQAARAVEFLAKEIRKRSKE